ncbi:MAG TPA: CopG family antitoxin [Candidatus Binataceae bacterium]|nr:CopG family antitoxin [Candidatus Binataceae bacterium]
MISRVSQQLMQKKTTLKPLPQFASEDEEREFWDTHDSTDYIDWSKAERDVLFANLKRSSLALNGISNQGRE